MEESKEAKENPKALGGENLAKFDPLR